MTVFLEPISKLILKRKREKVVADKEERGRSPEVQNRGPQKANGFLGQELGCVEDAFPLVDAVCRDCSLLQLKGILR